MRLPAFPSRHGVVAIILHWSIAALVLLAFALALFFNHRNDGDEAGQVAYQWHITVGMCVLALGLLRIAWRLTRAYPALPPDMPRAARGAARLAHALLYALTLAVSLTGWGIMTLRHQTASLLGLFDWPAIPFVASSSTHAERIAWYRFFVPAHSLLAWAGMALVAVHAAAALHHHFVRRDDVLRRMLPWQKVRDQGQEAT
jgi:cytochrome b561